MSHFIMYIVSRAAVAASTGLSTIEAVMTAQDRKDWKIRSEDSTVLLRS